MKILKRNCLKIPKNIKVLYCDKKNLIIFKGPQLTKSLNLKTKLFLMPLANTIIVTSLCIDNNLKGSKKLNKQLQGTMIAKIRQNLTEVANTLFCKLNLIGVGYKILSYNFDKICLKLGYSHLIYFNVPIGININCLNPNRLLISTEVGSYDSLTQLASQIRKCKSPEPYKGKGISYDKETVILKKGKKI